MEMISGTAQQLSVSSPASVFVSQFCLSRRGEGEGTGGVVSQHGVDGVGGSVCVAVEREREGGEGVGIALGGGLAFASLFSVASLHLKGRQAALSSNKSLQGAAGLATAEVAAGIFFLVLDDVVSWTGYDQDLGREITKAEDVGGGGGGG
ncbi:hypothetical protein B0H16DRAFT_1771872 [Mycena metata]|uniref:Uncharacterized protein n=1 Tax=Mycena metata TaxID=1033252 RepID=A0AAD7JW50_9AGAR|nr:hypothetical protein B0H16DRAFT_1771872 [Mycena metata]